MSTPEQPEKESSKTAEQAGDLEQNKAGGADQELRTDVSSEELEALQLAFVHAESRRRRQALLGGLLLLGVLGAFFWLMVGYEDSNSFRPQVEKGEQEVLAGTNDPVCRDVIDKVTTIGKQYYEQESAIESGLASSDRAEVLQTKALLEAQRENLAKSLEKSAGAIFRYDNSRGELERWFAFVDTEYGHLIRLAEERVVRMDSEGEPDAEAKKAEATSLDLQGRALLAIHESFHSFRVWHSSSLHPCGSAASELIPAG